jgi:hypothetical protein
MKQLRRLMEVEELRNADRGSRNDFAALVTAKSISRKRRERREQILRLQSSDGGFHIPQSAFRIPQLSLCLLKH